MKWIEIWANDGGLAGLLRPIPQNLDCRISRRPITHLNLHHHTRHTRNCVNLALPRRSPLFPVNINAIAPSPHTHPPTLALFSQLGTSETGHIARLRYRPVHLDSQFYPTVRHAISPTFFFCLCITYMGVHFSSHSPTSWFEILYPSFEINFFGSSRPATHTFHAFSRLKQ